MAQVEVRGVVERREVCASVRCHDRAVLSSSAPSQRWYESLSLGRRGESLGAGELDAVLESTVVIDSRGSSHEYIDSRVLS